jgi:hypothetical protein
MVTCVIGLLFDLWELIYFVHNWLAFDIGTCGAKGASAKLVSLAWR